MFKVINMPAVSECSISECAYNSDRLCHAIAITVGDGATPMCDTFFKAPRPGSMRANAGVGACKISACQHNRNFECGASRIQVGNQTHQHSCMTFAAR